MGFTRMATTRELEIRNENRYKLHPISKKRCTQCETVYNDIVLNFDIHHEKKNGTLVYVGQCKQCLKRIRANRTARYKKDIMLYVKRFLPAVRCRAKEQSLQFNLSPNTLTTLWKKQHGRCYYTNEKMNLEARTDDGKAPHIDFPSLDRLTPAKGYTKGNVVWCKYGVNRMKNALSKQQFVRFCKRVLEVHG